MIDKSIMKKLLLTFLSIAAVCCSLYAQRKVTQKRMEQNYEEVNTPYKYGLDVAQRLPSGPWIYGCRCENS